VLKALEGTPGSAFTAVAAGGIVAGIPTAIEVCSTCRFDTETTPEGTVSEAKAFAAAAAHANAGGAGKVVRNLRLGEELDVGTTTAL
jgi:hypothetical protein